MDTSSIRVISIVILLLVTAVYYLLRARKKATYTGYTRGTVIKTGYSPHSYYICFFYTVNGQRYEGRTSISSLQVKRFEPGMEIPVQYSLSNPANYYVSDPYYL